MMKNFLVKSLFKIASADWHIKKRKEKDLYAKYVRCHEISLKSFSHYLQGEWDYVYIDGEFDTIHLALRHTFYEVYKLWSENAPCNILYTDPDTLALRPLSIWGRYHKFMMFNLSEPKHFSVNNVYGEKFPYFCNAGVRYFPATMDQHTWDIGLAMADQWDLSDYNTEQVILNKMLWSQGMDITEILVPEMAYQAHWLPGMDIWRQDIWNGIEINRANILHVHSSRDLDKKLAWMEALSEQIK